MKRLVHILWLSFMFSLIWIGVAGVVYAIQLLARVSPELHAMFQVCTVVVAFPLYFWIAYRNEQRPLQRRARGHCPACGYDMRANPMRCSECGHEIRLAGNNGDARG